MILMTRTMPATALVLLLASCSGENFNDSGAVFRHFSIDSGTVSVHAKDAPDAIVNAAGEMSVAGTTVQTNAAQRELLAHYYAGILQLRDDGVAVGRAGIKTAGKAIGSVVAGLASGNPDKIGAKVDAQAQQVEKRVDELCSTLRDIRSTQQAIAAQLAAFRPYANIAADEVDHCR